MLEVDEKTKIIVATYGFMFKAIMLDKENRPLLKEIIHYVTKIPMKDLKNITVENIEHIVSNKKDKKMKSDIIVSVGNFCINIEMNRTYYNGLFQRNGRYLNKISSNLDDKDDDYINLKQAIQINFDNFSHFKTKKEIHKFVMKETETNEILGENISNYHIDMAFIYKECYNKPVSNLTRFQKICLMLRAKTYEELRKYSGDDEILKKVSDKIVNLSKNKKMIGLYNAEEEERKIRNTLRYNAEKEGFSRGMTRGIEQNKSDLAKKMLAKGININDISEITGLSIKEINNLK